MTEKSKFCGLHLKHIITRNLRIIQNKKLREFPTKGPNYREPKGINCRKAYFEIDQALETSTLTSWRESVLNIVKEKIKKLKHEIQPK